MSVQRIGLDLWRWSKYLQVFAAVIYSTSADRKLIFSSSPPSQSGVGFFSEKGRILKCRLSWLTWGRGRQQEQVSEARGDEEERGQSARPVPCTVTALPPSCTHFPHHCPPYTLPPGCGRWWTTASALCYGPAGSTVLQGAALLPSPAAAWRVRERARLRSCPPREAQTPALSPGRQDFTLRDCSLSAPASRIVNDLLKLI